MSGTVIMGAITVSSIASDSALSITSSTGNIQLGGYTFPDTTPSEGDVLVTDGSGNLSFAAANQRVDVSSATYTIQPSDNIVAITVQEDVVVTLPPPSSKTVGDIIYIVKEADGLSSVSVSPSGTELISGQEGFSFSQAYGATKLYTNGTNWFILY